VLWADAAQKLSVIKDSKKSFLIIFAIKNGRTAALPLD
jgi:hypothetical protein